MKRIYYFLTGVAVLFSSCTIEMPENTEEQVPTRTVTIKMDSTDLTKTTFNSGMTGLNWETGDQVAYFIDETGTRKVAIIENGTFSVALDENAHTIHIVYPVSENADYNEVTYAAYPKNIVPTNQAQTTLNGEVTDFNGKNLPITGSANIAAGTGNVEVSATYDIAAAAVLAFTITGASDNEETISSLSIFTTDGAKMLSEDQNYAKLTFPEGTKVKDLQDKTVYAVVKAADYGEVKVSMITDANTYVLSTDITSKGNLTGFGNKQIYKYKWNLQSASTGAISGLMVKLGSNAWTSWDGTKEQLQEKGLTSGGTFGTDEAPYSVKVATGGITTFSYSNGSQLRTALQEINSTSVIAVDMSDAAFQADAGKQLFQDVTTLKSFVFPIGEKGKLITTLESMFYGCSNLESVSAIPLNVTSVSRLFQRCTKFNQKVVFPSSVTDMSFTFYYCSQFNQHIEIPKNVVNLNYTFSGCGLFNQPVVIPSKVTDMSNTFSYCSAFNQEVSVPANVTNMSLIFYNCSNFNSQVTIAEGVKNMSYAFYGCPLFNQPISIPKSVTTLDHTFYNCIVFNSSVTIPVDSEIGTMECTFYSCELFDQPIIIPSKVTNINTLLGDCSHYNQPTSIPSTVSDMSYAFAGCTALTSEITINMPAGKIPGFSYDENTIGIGRMFQNCQTNKIDLKVSNAQLGESASVAAKRWYNEESVCSWTFKSLTGI